MYFCKGFYFLETKFVQSKKNYYTQKRDCCRYYCFPHACSQIFVNDFQIIDRYKKKSLIKRIKLIQNWARVHGPLSAYCLLYLYSTQLNLNIGPAGRSTKTKTQYVRHNCLDFYNFTTNRYQISQFEHLASWHIYQNKNTICKKQLLALL